MGSCGNTIIYRDKKEQSRMIDPREKERLFEVTIKENDWWLNIIARNNAPINSCEDLEQEIRMAFWKGLDSYDGEGSRL
jgi:hypothetical protein